MTKRNYPYISFHSIKYDIILMKKLLNKFDLKDADLHTKDNLLFCLNQQWKYIKRLEKWFRDNIDLFQSEEEKNLWKIVEEYRKQPYFKEIQRIGKMCNKIAKQCQELESVKTITTTSGIKIEEED